MRTCLENSSSGKVMIIECFLALYILVRMLLGYCASFDLLGKLRCRSMYVDLVKNTRLELV